MKRPEGFDRPDRRGPESARPPRTAPPGRGAEARPQQGRPASPSRPEASGRPATPPRPRTPATPPEAPAASPRELLAEARREERAARADARRARRERRRAERGEVRRFTQRSRRRRIGWLTAAGIGALLLVLVGALVVSPLLALRTITIEGASRLDPAVLQEALADQLGTPLALIDGDEVERSLGAFPGIESFVTEAVPPSTLVVRIVEREPVLALAVPEGFELVDAAGVHLGTQADRPTGVPQIVVPGDELDSAVFRNAAAVVASLDQALRDRVVRVDATSQDDVTLLLDGVGQTVVWGNAERPAAKTALLNALMGNEDPDAVVQYDVRSPSTGIVRR